MSTVVSDKGAVKMGDATNRLGKFSERVRKFLSKATPVNGQVPWIGRIVVTDYDKQVVQVGGEVK